MSSANLLIVLAGVCAIFSIFWFAAIGFFHNALVGILTFFIPPFGIVVVTALDPKPTLYPWLLIVLGIIFFIAGTVLI